MQYQGVMTSAGPVKLRPGKGKKGAGPPPEKVSVQDMIDEIRAKFDITDEEALYIKAGNGREVGRPDDSQHGSSASRRSDLSRRPVSRAGQRGYSDRPTMNAVATRNWRTRNTPIPAASSTSWP